MSGVIAGGWEFVAAAYIVTAAVLGTYAASVLLRYKKERSAGDPGRESKP